MNQVTILNTDKQIKAAILADRLVWANISFTFEKMVAQYTISVAEKDVKVALGGV